MQTWLHKILAHNQICVKGCAKLASMLYYLSTNTRSSIMFLYKLPFLYTLTSKWLKMGTKVSHHMIWQADYGWMINCYWCNPSLSSTLHDDVIKWKHFPRNWPFVREIHRSPVNFPHKGQWRGALMFSLIYVWINDWVNNREAGDLRRQHGHYDVIVM